MKKKMVSIVAPKKCPKCGAKLRAGSKTCPKCGAILPVF